MKRLRHYIASHILMAIGIVTLALTGLQIFILFVNQMPDIGNGGYDLFSAMKVVGFQLPYQIYMFFPIASLLGVLMGLGIMANHRELVVIRSAGVSVPQITWVVLQIAFVLMLIVTWLGESIIPEFNRLALEEKVQTMSGGQTLRTVYGVWMHEKQDYIFIGSADSSTNVMKSVLQFHFDEDHHLQYVRKIDQLEFAHGHWDAIGVVQTLFHKQKTEIQRFARMPWDSKMQLSILQLSTFTPDEMTLRQLYNFIASPHDQSISNEILVFFQRLMQPFSTMVMMILAIPFIFGPLRSSTIGAKMLIGACAGFTFYTFNHFLGSMSQVFQLPPIIAATFPTLLFACIGGFMLTRVR